MATGTSGAEEPLAGGVANAGAVVRVGDHVLRPAPTNVEDVHALLRHVRARGGDIVPEPVGVDADGSERLVHIDGDVPVPPFPRWVQTDDALASVASLLRSYHDAAAGFVAPSGAAWSTEMADPDGGGAAGAVVGHNDVCLENVVFRDGRAVALLDFEFAAPGSPLHDLKALASMCVPVSDPDFRRRVGWRPDLDVPRRLRVVADAYGLDGPGRAELLDRLTTGMATAGAFVARRIAAGDQAFVEMVESFGGMASYDRRREWFAAERARLAAALGVPG